MCFSELSQNDKETEITILKNMQLKFWIIKQLKIHIQKIVRTKKVPVAQVEDHATIENI